MNRENVVEQGKQDGDQHPPLEGHQTTLPEPVGAQEGPESLRCRSQSRTGGYAAACHITGVRARTGSQVESRENAPSTQGRACEPPPLLARSSELARTRRRARNPRFPSPPQLWRPRLSHLRTQQGQYIRDCNPSKKNASSTTKPDHFQMPKQHVREHPTPCREKAVQNEEPSHHAHGRQCLPRQGRTNISGLPQAMRATQATATTCSATSSEDRTRKRNEYSQGETRRQR